MGDNAKLESLFDEYQRCDAAWIKKKEELVRATAKRSDAVKAIAQMIAPERKLKYKGKELSIVVREETYFFRTPKGAKIEVG